MPLQQRFASTSALLMGCALLTCVLLPVRSFAQMTFQPSQPIQFHSDGVAFSPADFNNDGRDDLVLAAYDSKGIFGWTLALSNGNGRYATPIAMPGYPSAVGDFNGDGNLDFAELGSVLGINGNAVTIHLGNGDGTFHTLPSFAGMIPPYSGMEWNVAAVLAVDLNHDGKTDLVEVMDSAASSYPVVMQILISNGDGTFTPGQTILGSTGSLALEGLGGSNAVTGDFDGDGRPDVALLYTMTPSTTNPTTIFVPTTLQVWYGDGAGHLGSPFLLTNPKYYADSFPIAADLNNDGRSDIVAVSLRIGTDGGTRNTPLLSVYTGKADRTMSYSTMVTNECPQGLAVADFNGDGLNDLVTEEVSCGVWSPVTDFAIRLGQSSGGFGQEEALYQSLNVAYQPYAVRTTLGTKPDIAFSQFDGGGNDSLTLLTNTSGGAFPGCGPTGFATGIQVCTPTGGAVTSPVKFSVGAAGPTPMRTVAVWADGKKLAEQITHAFSNYSFLDASVPLTAGSHAVTVIGTGWDNTLQQKSFTLNVSGGCSAPAVPGIHVCQPTSVAPSSPVAIQATATIVGKLGRMEVWVDGGKRFTETNSTTMNTNLSVTTGLHRFDFYAVNTAGIKWHQAVTTTVK